MNELCSKIDACQKLDTYRDRAMLPFQFADAVKLECARCNEFSIGEQDELLLTEIVDVLANTGTRCYNAGQDWKDNPINYQEKAQEIVTKVKQHYEQKARDAYSRGFKDGRISRRIPND